ncbi:MAG TPA: hypothetical protein VM283_05960, partial [Armatimonadota bacterium]|nr:hypothetical protein [Armatimonadota bacterium]
YLVRSLVERIPAITDSYHADTGRFGTEPWICSDQNHIFPLAVAWALDDPANPYHHDDAVLQMIARAGEALVGDQDERGMWTFRKKDNSTWGQTAMPWTYSRWVRAYELVREALPAESREKWERGLLLGYGTIAATALGRVHNIPTHHAMGLYIAGLCFDRPEWREQAKAFMPQVVAAQDPAGFWTENFGPVVGYNFVYIDALGVYYHYSQDPAALEALRRAAVFHSAILWPDGSSVSCIDERVIYHDQVAVGNVGFSWTPEGRGFLLKQVWLASGGGERPVEADFAASMLQYGGEGPPVPPPAEADQSTVTLGDRDALIRRHRPWQWAMSAYATPPTQSRWIQDRQNLVDIYHDDLGLVAGGGNTKLQPYWSTFTVGDPALLSHTPGDEEPNFVPEVDLRWTPEKASITTAAEPELLLTYGDVEASFAATPREDGSLALAWRAPAGRRVQAHLPLLNRSSRIVTAAGERIRLTGADLHLTAADVGGWFRYGDLRVTMPEGSWLLWPALQHNPYTKDGSSSPSAAKLVVVLPFEDAGERTVVLSHAPEPPFDGMALDARELPIEISEGSYTKVLDGLGSRFLGRNEPGSFIRFTLPEIAPGRYEVLGDFVLADVYGIVRVLLDGEPIGEPFDAYCEGVDAEGWLVSFGEAQLGPGQHTLTIELVGRNERAKNTMISIKRWLLRPIG